MNQSHIVSQLFSSNVDFLFVNNKEELENITFLAFIIINIDFDNYLKE